MSNTKSLLKELKNNLGFGSKNNSQKPRETDKIKEKIIKKTKNSKSTNQNQSGSAKRKSMTHQNDLLTILLKEPNQTNLHPAQDFLDKVMYFGIKTQKDNWVISSNREYFHLGNDLPKDFNFRHKEIDTCRFSPDAVMKFLEGSSHVNPAELFKSICDFIKRYMFFPTTSQADLIALWIMGTYVFSIFRYFPYIWLNAEKASGKSLLLRIVSKLAFNGQVLLDPTPAVLFRDVDHNRPTLLIDEFERFRKQDKENKGALMATLNSGFENGNIVKRNERASGGGYKLLEYHTYSPKILAGINDIDDVLQDRTILLKLLRKTDNEVTERFKDTQSCLLEQKRIRDNLYLFALEWANDLSLMYNNEEESILGVSHLDNRELDIWEPLFVIANLVDVGSDSKDITNALTQLSKLSSIERQADNIDKNETFQMLSVFSSMMVESQPIEKDINSISFEAEKTFEHFQNTDDFSWLKSRKSLTSRFKRIEVRSLRIKKSGRRIAVYKINISTFKDLCSRFKIDIQELEEQWSSGTIL